MKHRGNQGIAATAVLKRQAATATQKWAPELVPKTRSMGQLNRENKWKYAKMIRSSRNLGGLWTLLLNSMHPMEAGPSAPFCSWTFGAGSGGAVGTGSLVNDGLRKWWMTYIYMKWWTSWYTHIKWLLYLVNLVSSLNDYKSDKWWFCWCWGESVSSIVWVNYNDLTSWPHWNHG